jgi:hypothetical protein
MTINVDRSPIECVLYNVIKYFFDENMAILVYIRKVRNFYTIQSFAPRCVVEMGTLRLDYTAADGDASRAWRGGGAPREANVDQYQLSAMALSYTGLAGDIGASRR